MTTKALEALVCLAGAKWLLDLLLAPLVAARVAALRRQTRRVASDLGYIDLRLGVRWGSCPLARMLLSPASMQQAGSSPRRSRRPARLRAWTAAVLALCAAACASDPRALQPSPELEVTSPPRALWREQPGPVDIAGRVAPSADGAPIASVAINGAPAVVADDGTFSARVYLPAGATALHTVVRDRSGGEATDTRTVHVGARRSSAELLAGALTVALSDEALAKLAVAASALVTTTDLAPLLAPRNPMVAAGAETGEDCLWGKLYVDDLDLASARFSLEPEAGRLRFEADLGGLDVRARARYAALCAPGSTTVRLGAGRLVVRGELAVTPGGGVLAVTVEHPEAQVTGFWLTASGLPGEVLQLLDLDAAIGAIAAGAIEGFLGPVLGHALAGLAGPKQVSVGGLPVAFELAAEQVDFDVTGVRAQLASRMGLGGAPVPFITTPTTDELVEPTGGLAVGLSVDAVNQLLASATAAGLLSLTMPAPGGTFETVRISAELPPMVAAHHGTLRLVAGELRLALLSHGQEVTHVALTVAAELAVVPSAKGLALQVTRPEVHADVLDSLSGYQDADKEDLIELVVAHQLEVLAQLVGNVPLPALAGVTVTEPRLFGDGGLVQLSARLE